MRGKGFFLDFLTFLIFYGEFVGSSDYGEVMMEEVCIVYFFFFFLE